MSDQPEWRRRDLLPGATTFQIGGWVLISIAIAAVGAIGSLIWGFGVAPKTKAWDPVGIAVFALFAGGSVAAFVFDRWSDLKAKREIEAGYTTVNGNHQVERVHSRSGIVVREAGEPNLTKEQWEAAMNRVRAYEESIASGRR
ncbi:hypothetical protein [Leifsonia sp. NPDC080035]|uniref:Uncharacterized protein n=1 Tax=Leifsonia sp. NPDC080035 TaxID=3143936 RepID=A0AAU7G7M2_9MICO